MGKSLCDSQGGSLVVVPNLFRYKISPRFKVRFRIQPGTSMRVLRSALLLIVVCLSSTWLTPAHAQDAPSDNTATPKPAGKSPTGVLIDDDSSQESAPDLQPDTQPLTGTLNPTLGVRAIRHSFWVPGVQFSSEASSTALGSSDAAGWNSANYVLGSLSVLDVRGHSQFAANYSGGRYFSTNGSLGSGSIHELDVLQSFEWRRWQIAMLDQFWYLPEAEFGFGAGTNISVPGIGGALAPALASLKDNYQLYQSVFTSNGPRYTNSITGQAVYAISRRASINFAGSYGILRFVELGNTDGNNIVFRLGYNYSISRNDTIGILYRFTEYRYIGNTQALNDHVIAGAYGRKITGRLALQAFAGPEITTLRFPDPNSNHPVGGLFGATFTYAAGPNHLGLTFTHGVSSGSGVFAGATTNQLQTNLDRQLSRHWHGHLNVGYARNTNLSSAENGGGTGSFNSSYFGVSFDRPIGQQSNITIGYTGYVQTSDEAACNALSACSGTYTNHRITLGLSWHASPFVIR
jgi:hypothetical protein